MKQVLVGSLVAKCALLGLAAILPVYGCSLVASVDRSAIQGEGGAGAAGGTGGAGAASCTDAVQNGDESDVDCGGADCPACVNGLTCEIFSDCQSQFCNVDTCAPCSGDPDCADAPSTYCSGQMCVGTKALGQACVGANECSSGWCADATCCNVGCTGACEACDLSGSEGTCTALADAAIGEPTCAPYLCNGTTGTCPTTCAGNEDCVAMPLAYCDTTTTNTCIGNKDDGVDCVNGAECKSEHCVDSVCCASEACGTTTDCDVCNATGFEGVCHAADDNSPCGDGVCNQCDGTTTVCGESPTGVPGPGCTDTTNDTCTDPDTCEAGGVCNAHHVLAGDHVGCGECHECDGAGTCTQHSTNNQPGPSCAAGSVTTCDLANTCVDGACLPNYVTALSHTACGTDPCHECDGAGTCTQHSTNNQPGPGCQTGAASTCDLADQCVDGTCSPNYATAASHTACGTDPCHECDGSGNCTQHSDNGVPGPGCQTGAASTCDLADVCLDGACDPSYVTSVSATACGTDPCHECDGSGNCTQHSQNGVPGPGCETGAASTCDLADVCLSGACDPSYVTSVSETACGTDPCHECDGSGTCTQHSENGVPGPGCETGAASTCDLADVCLSGACDPNYVTSVSETACGTCHECDGLGACEQHSTSGLAGPSCTDSTDNTCTDPDTCDSNGNCAPNNAAEGTSCADNGGTRCNNAGQCVLTFMVVRIGDGSAALAAAAPVFVEERYVSDGSLVARTGNPIALPTADGAGNQMLTLTGAAPTVGHLSLSANGAYVTLAGYDAPVGTTSAELEEPTAFSRSIGRIDASYSVDTSTLMQAFGGASSAIRGATTDDGTRFWASGAGSSAGVRYALRAASGAPTLIMTTPDSSRGIHIFGGQLYADNGSASFYTVFTVGSNLPTSGPVTATILTGLPNVNTQRPGSFALLDLDADSTFDTLYIADERAYVSGGGIYKYTYGTGTWSAATFTLTGLSTGVRGLAARKIGSDVTILATTMGDSANSVLRIIDTGSGSATAVSIHNAVASTGVRGIAFAPR